MRQKLFVIFLCLFLSILGVEFLLRGYFSVKKDFDIEMWRYARLLKQSVFDNRSHIHIPDSSADIMGVDVLINSRGLRDYEYPYNKESGVYRILVVGDSMTFGFGTEQSKTFPKVLERFLNDSAVNGQSRLFALNGKKIIRYEVINAGIGNYNTAQELAFLVNEGYKYQSDQILLAFYLNDAEKTQKYKENFFTKNYLTYIFLKSLKNKIEVVFDKNRQYENYYQNLYAGENFNEYKKILEELTNFGSGQKSKLSVVLIPEFHSFNPYPFSAIHLKIKNFFTQKGRDVMDAAEVFDGKESKKFWVAKDDMHPNASGHQLIGEYIFQKINL